LAAALIHGARVGAWKTTEVSPRPAARVTVPARRRLKSGQQPQRRRLAAAGRPDQGDDLAGVQRQVDRSKDTTPGVVDLHSGKAGDRPGWLNQRQGGEREG
jgi:hypothetical protein